MRPRRPRGTHPVLGLAEHREHRRPSEFLRPVRRRPHRGRVLVADRNGARRRSSSVTQGSRHGQVTALTVAAGASRAGSTRGGRTATSGAGVGAVLHRPRRDPARVVRRGATDPNPGRLKRQLEDLPLTRPPCQVNLSTRRMRNASSPVGVCVCRDDLDVGEEGATWGQPSSRARSS